MPAETPLVRCSSPLSHEILVCIACVCACVPVDRCAAHLGRFCYVPVGKLKAIASPESTTHDFVGTPAEETGSVPRSLEVHLLSAEGGGDFCVPYGAANALIGFGDSKLWPKLVEAARDIEQKERQMEALRIFCVDSGNWHVKAIKSSEDLAAFDPLGCSQESVYVLHIKEIDGARDHAVGIARGRIFDANRRYTLPLSSAGLKAIGYTGIVSATSLTPSRKLSAAIERSRAREPRS